MYVVRIGGRKTQQQNSTKHKRADLFWYGGKVDVVPSPHSDGKRVCMCTVYRRAGTSKWWKGHEYEYSSALSTTAVQEYSKPCFVLLLCDDYDRYRPHTNLPGTIRVV